MQLSPPVRCQRSDLRCILRVRLIIYLSNGKFYIFMYVLLCLCRFCIYSMDFFACINIIITFSF